MRSHSRNGRVQQHRASVVHVLRLLIVIGMLLAIRSPSERHDDVGQVPELAMVQGLIPTAQSIDPQADASGLWSVRDEQGRMIGSVTRTLPIAESIVGYRGPSESLIALDTELHVIAVALIHSSDTSEHVEAVQRDSQFFQQFHSWSWGGPPTGQKVDAVSGATLTSLAIAGGVLKRIGGDRPSLVFPDNVAVAEVQQWFPNAARADAMGGRPAMHVIRDSKGQVIGHVIRTGPLADSIDGYQGPTEMLLRLGENPHGPIQAIRIRSSFDNEPYVGYVRDEYGFWPIFEQQTMEQLAEFDLVAAEVEGVSGATMTSMAVAETLVASAKKYQQQEFQPIAEPTTWWQDLVTATRWSLPDIATVAVLIAAVWFRMRGWFRRPWWRRFWLATVVIVIGLWAGNLLSMSLVAGWSAEGVAWRLAPGLTLIALVAFLSPPLSKSNPYCNHLCPHGALQQWIKPSAKSKRKWSPPRRLVRWLSFLPGTMLVVAYVGLVLYPTLDVSSWEPFHAYLFRIAPWGALLLAAGTLVISAFVPMAYCRLGCPTGRLLDHLRRKASSAQIQLADVIAIGLLLFAWSWSWWK
ncbi:FMN-binding protein [Stieleria varia]|uniref:Electron transport complex subunit RsxG n=1 Tax=Stieleria varia TaxID=2528005 RepID=A0A5C6B657_9BACT|nr:FMN-binding protein [Stieleria varia]TWU07533.1 Electron transport complex subunit RsxG [Stieleria varia]